ncbi:uncharacterized protein BP5553_06757 [Venustampulla echinocandica]|uniref:Uncharacterized protein n=1 Tax=Venustampulla echinocandica TaxID=2656787 RepID=A0A370TKV8_9HELO|nr:uncharacterized protein BP5553_06757 [Venustampulla echinocandica]RDL36145.1 hypothetical protein BP5553_06757 [Venustampulla echinocandica]
MPFDARSQLRIYRSFLPLGHLSCPPAKGNAPFALRARPKRETVFLLHAQLALPPFKPASLLLRQLQIQPHPPAPLIDVPSPHGDDTSRDTRRPEPAPSTLHPRSSIVLVPGAARTRLRSAPIAHPRLISLYQIGTYPSVFFAAKTRTPTLGSLLGFSSLSPSGAKKTQALLAIHFHQRRAAYCHPSPGITHRFVLPKA